MSEGKSMTYDEHLRQLIDDESQYVRHLNLILKIFMEAFSDRRLFLQTVSQPEKVPFALKIGGLVPELSSRGEKRGRGGGGEVSLGHGWNPNLKLSWALVYYLSSGCGEDLWQPD